MNITVVTAGAAMAVAPTVGGQRLGLCIIGLGIVIGLIAATVWWLEWLSESHKKLRQGASLIWPVASLAYANMTSCDGDERDRASLQPVAQKASPPGSGVEDADLMDLGEYLYPRRGAPRLSISDIDRMESGRVMIRDAIDTLCGSKKRLRISANYIRKHVGPWHKGTCILFWYMEVALANQIGLSRVATYDAVRAMVEAIKQDEA